MDELERQKLEGFMLCFKKHGDQCGFDWLALVAQAYQESGLDHAHALSRELLREKALQLQALEASGAEQEGASKRRLRSMGS